MRVRGAAPPLPSPLPSPLPLLLGIFLLFLFPSLMFSFLSSVALSFTRHFSFSSFLSCFSFFLLLFSLFPHAILLQCSHLSFLLPFFPDLLPFLFCFPLTRDFFSPSILDFLLSFFFLFCCSFYTCQSFFYSSAFFQFFSFSLPFR